MATITNEIIDRLNVDSVIAGLKAQTEAEAKLVKISAELGAKKTALVKIINQQEAATRREEKAQEALLSGFAGGLAGIAALAAGVQALAEQTDALSDASARSSLSPAFLESLGAAATAGGGKLDDLNGVVNTFSKRLGEAASGKAGGAAAAFKALGVSAKDVAGNLRPAEDVFSDLVTAIAKLPDATDRSTAAVQAFGKGAGPLLESGILNSTTALAAFRQEVDTFGISSAPGAAAAADQWQGALGQLKLVMDGAGAKLLERFGPAATTALQDFTLGLVAVKELGVIPLESAMNTLNEIFGAWKAVIGADSLDELKRGLREVGQEFDRNQKQIEAETTTAMENVKAFYEASKAARDLAGAQGAGADAGERYRIINAANAQAAAKAEASLKAEHDAVIALTLSIEAAQSPFEKLLQKYDKIDKAAAHGAVTAEEAARARTAAAAEWEEAVNKEVAAEQEKTRKLQEEKDKQLKAQSDLELAIAHMDNQDKQNKLNTAAAWLDAGSKAAAALGDIYQRDADAKMDAAKAGDKEAQKAIQKDFKAQQAAAYAGALLDAAAAEINVLATVPFPLSIPASVIVGATAAADIAAIKQTPPPTFGDAALPPIGGNGNRTINVHQQDYVAAAKDPTNLMANAERAVGGRSSRGRSWRPRNEETLAYNAVGAIQDVQRLVRG